LYEAHASHVPNLFFDESLKQEIYKTWPYNRDPNKYTTNADGVFLPEIVKASIDPTRQYVYVGDKLSDSLFEWITLRINATETQACGPCCL
jgi:hypothetical protein